MSIEDIWKKINPSGGLPEKRREILIIGIVILASTASFGLGRMSVSAGDKKPIMIEKGVEKSISAPQNISGSAPSAGAQSSVLPAAIVKAPTATGAFFASKNGTRYYPAGCKAGNRIAEKNKIFFNTPQEAELLGLSKAVGCK